jgi:hypothetical protein
MSARSRWQRLDAEHWIWVLGALQTTLLSLATVVSVLGGFVAGALWIALFPGAFAALSGWLTSAWRRDEPWSWWAWTVLSGVGLLGSLGQLLGTGPSWTSVGGFVFDGALLIFLFHPDSRARIDPPDPAAVRPSRRVRSSA